MTVDHLPPYPRCTGHYEIFQEVCWVVGTGRPEHLQGDLWMRHNMYLCFIENVLNLHVTVICNRPVN